MTQKSEVVVEKSLKISELLTYNPMQLVFLVFSLLTVGAMVPFVYYSYEFVEKIKSDAPEGYEFPSIWDFRMTAVSGCVFACS